MRGDAIGAACAEWKGQAMKLRLVWGLLVATLGTGWAGLALANDRDLQGTTIPAASCVAVGGDNAATGGRWANPAFVLNGIFPESPTFSDQRLQCALPINNVELSSRNSNDNDLSRVRVIYRDGDGLGAATFVGVTLYKTSFAAGTMQTVPVCQWNSNTSGTGSTEFTRSIFRCAHDLAQGALYHFEVQLYTTQAGGSTVVAGFAGIDFPP